MVHSNAFENYNPHHLIRTTIKITFLNNPWAPVDLRNFKLQRIQTDNLLSREPTCSHRRRTFYSPPIPDEYAWRQNFRSESGIEYSMGPKRLRSRMIGMKTHIYSFCMLYVICIYVVVFFPYMVRCSLNGTVYTYMMWDRNINYMNYTCWDLV